MIGWYTVWGSFWVRWVTESRSTRLHRWRVRKGVVKGWPRDKRLRGFTKTWRTGWSSPSSSYLSSLREVVRKKSLHYHQLYINRPDPIPFLPVVVDTTGRLYDDFSRLLFLHVQREDSVLDNEILRHEDFYTSWLVISVFYTLYLHMRGSLT